MPRYNLIDDQESDNFDSYFKEPEQEKKIESDIKPNTGFDIPESIESGNEENPFEIETENEFEYPPENIEVPPSPQDSIEEESPPAQDRESYSQPAYYEDYEDTKQEKINYKPILIIIIVLIVAVAAYFVATKFIFKSKDAAEVPETVSPVKSEREIQRENALMTIFKQNNGKLGFISRIHDAFTRDVYLSSILLYDNELSFEVFTKNRDALSPFNLQIKNNPSMSGLVLSTTTTRPGSRGGIFALYSTNAIPTASAVSTPSPDSVYSRTPEDFVAIATSQFGLTLKNKREITSGSNALFSTKRLEYLFTGSESNCWKFLTLIGSDTANYGIYKLLFLPLDQKSIAQSTYELSIIVDFYL